MGIKKPDSFCRWCEYIWNYKEEEEMQCDSHCPNCGDGMPLMLSETEYDDIVRYDYEDDEIVSPEQRKELGEYSDELMDKIKDRFPTIKMKIEAHETVRNTLEIWEKKMGIRELVKDLFNDYGMPMIDTEDNGVFIERNEHNRKLLVHGQVTEYGEYQLTGRFRLQVFIASQYMSMELLINEDTLVEEFAMVAQWVKLNKGRVYSGK